MINVKTERKRYFGNYRIFYIPAENNEYASCIEVKDPTKELSEWMELSSLITWPPFRRKGYATKLLNVAYQFASDQQKGVYLYVEIDNVDAIKLYEKCGFIKLRRWKVRKFKDSNDYFHFYIMVKSENANYHDIWNYFYNFKMNHEEVN